MDRDRNRDLTEDELEARLRQAIEEEREGRLVSCSTAEEVRALMAQLRRERLTWRIDYTSRIRADIVGLDPDVSDAITDLLMAWTVSGPPRENERIIGGLTLYEQAVADRYLLGYMANDERPSLVLLWLRDRPSGQLRD